MKIKFTDSITALPHQHTLIDALELHLSQARTLGLLVASVHGLDSIEETEGEHRYNQILKSISELIRKTIKENFSKKDLVCLPDFGIPTFLIFLCNSHYDKMGGTVTNDIETIGRAFEELLQPKISKLFAASFKSPPKLVVGHAAVVHNPLIRPRRIIHRLVEEAKQMARINLPLSRIKNKERLQQLIVEENIRTLYQPIIDLRSGKTMGFEALTRGPADSTFENPLNLFSIARDVGLIFELDRLCRRKALYNSKGLPSNSKLFINSLPATIHDPEFRGAHLKNVLKQVDKKPQNLVFEINERFTIDNFATFREATKYYTDQGMSIAIDDTGTGYSTLEAIVELKPQYLKFDISMVNGIANDMVKQEMFKIIRVLAKSVKATIIAEGIETKEDLSKLESMGLEYGQGYFFAKPLPLDQAIKIRP